MNSKIKLFKRFLSNYGKILPSEFIPQLKSMPPIISVSNMFDGTLPKIEGYHSEQDSYVFKSFEKEIIFL